MDGEIGGFSGWLKGHLTLVALCAVTAVAVSGALAIATVPDGNGVIHACYQTDPAGGSIPGPGPNVRVIDPAAGQTCNPPGEVALNFSQQGPAGPAGAQGPAGQTGAGGPPGPAGEDGDISAGDCPNVVGHITLSGSPDLSFDACRILKVRLGPHGLARDSSSGTTEYEITRLSDSNSPKLAKATIQGTLFKTATIEVYKPGTTTIGQTLKLSNAAISSFKAGLGQMLPTDVLILISAPKKGT